MMLSLTTPNDLSETQCLGLAFCLQGAVTSQWRAHSAGFTFTPVCRLLLICWSSWGSRVNLHNYLVSWPWPCLWRYCFEKSFLVSGAAAPGDRQSCRLAKTTAEPARSCSGCMWTTCMFKYMQRLVPFHMFFTVAQRRILNCTSLKTQEFCP